MKKMFIFASLIGIVTSAVYLLCKNERPNNNYFKSDNSNVDFNSNKAKESPSCESNAMEEMYQAKFENAQAVQERHSEASEIMSDAFKNILSDIEPIILDQETEDIVIDSESNAVMDELDSISDELDNLLK